MSAVSTPRNDQRRAFLPPALVVVAAVTAPAVALLSQYVGGLQPCVLCIWQRWPYVAAIVFGIAGLALARRPAALRVLLALAGAAFLVSAGIAVFHVGVEQHWWQGTSECGSSLSGAQMSLEELKAMLEAAPVVRCDEVAWSLFGISMAGYNAIYAGIAGLLALWSAAAAPWQAVPVGSRQAKDPRRAA
jgi:disulfide bond formation protein DsbB